ncbi:hypothetical protein CAL26_10675 [Bordetella genomosp. 9]|uniref:AB hydrolase-1 domain-containing protein n=1 Tax=Bordetella genomosp. 9 TaxID=1416803 RepID=A0A261RFP6_9BORD|nr:alpha/beta fold hydrolase [Bordetella genomosp. 9]OZI23868.1 hypothetical protein CAL26_10675 [Bordetella genomosp. 9]
MVTHRCTRLALLLIIASLLAACTANSPRRYAADCSQAPLSRPASASPIETVAASSAQDSYVLGFVELDDQGHLYCRNQMNDVVGRLRTEAAQRDVLMVVFVHGWRHDDKPDDENLKTFRVLLDGLVADEHALADSERAPRRVVGVYVAWRGMSLTPPGLQYLTFWDRKNTAATIGHGDVTEVLTRLEQVKREKDDRVGQDSATRLVIIGHSFGGLIVHTALSQIMVSRFVRTGGPPVQYGGPARPPTEPEPGDDDEIQVQGFGSLVVLINPAFEAQLFSSLSDISAEHAHYARDQAPLMAVMTSEADSATGILFPMGRRVSTLFENTRTMTRWNATTGQLESINESEAIITSVGHFLPYRTHRLYPRPDRPERKPDPANRELRAESMMDASRLRDTVSAAEGWTGDSPGSKISFRDVVLERTENSAGRNPYLVINVDKRLIASHGDLGNPGIRSFIKDLVLISTVPPPEKKRLFLRFNAM